MADRKSGPVKPPVIDLTARPAEPAKPGAPPEATIAAVPQGPERPGAPAAPGTNPAIEPPKAAAEGVAQPADKRGDSALAGEKPDNSKTADPKSTDTKGEKPAGQLKSPTDKPMPRKAPGGGPMAVGAIGGAIIAIGVTYAIANAGFWPSPKTDTELRIAQLQDRLAQAEASDASNAKAVADLTGRLTSLEGDVDGKLAASADGLTKLQQSVAGLQAAKPPAVDLSPLEAQIKTLSSRLDAVASGASSADAGAIAANLATAQRSLTDLSNKVAALDSHATATDNTIANLNSEFASAKSAIDQAARAPSPKAIASAMQLPLLISALESDFAAGRPYATDLGNLTAAVPEAHAPASVSAAATSGMPAPDDLARQLDAAMPDMLSARPAGTDSSWQGQASDWVKRMLALRPQGALTGDSPEALASQLQEAVSRHDFAGAAKLFDQLPQPMQQAAGDLDAKIKTLADADAFLANLRQTALAPAAGVQQ